MSRTRRWNRLSRVAASVVGLLALLASAPVSWGQEGTAEPEESALTRCLREGRAAYDAADYEAFVRSASCALAELPGHPRLIYNLACGQSLGGDAKGAVDSLERLVAMGLYFDLSADSDFDPIREQRGFRRVERRMDRLTEPRGRARRWLRLDAPEVAAGRFVPEGLAYDAATGDLYLGSVHRRRLVRVPRDGEPQVIAGADDGLGAVFGLAVDSERRTLWACTADLPQMEGFDPAAEPRAALLRVDLAGGNGTAATIAARFPVPAGEGEATCNDLTVGPSGEVFVADSRGGGLYRLAVGGETLEALVPPGGGLRSPNGLALSRDGTAVFVADYPAGLMAVELASGEVAKLNHPPDVALRGIDGLTRHGSTLLAIQNGVNPHRVLAIDLSSDGRSVRRAEVLLANHPDFDEPTLGTVVDGRLLLVANSHWNRFTEDNTLPPAAELEPPIVLEVALD